MQAACPPPGHRHPLATAMDGLYRACIWVAGTAIVLMSLIVPVGVVLRYVFGVGAQWPEPIAILLMVVFTFLGAAVAYRAGGHIAVGMLTDHLPPKLQRPLAFAVHGLMVTVCGFVLVYGARLCVGTMGQSIAELPWMPVGVTYLAIPLGALVTLLFVLEHMAWGSQKSRPVVSIGNEQG